MTTSHRSLTVLDAATFDEVVGAGDVPLVVDAALLVKDPVDERVERYDLFG